MLQCNLPIDFFLALSLFIQFLHDYFKHYNSLKILMEIDDHQECTTRPKQQI